MKKDPVGLKAAFALAGDELNARLDEQMLTVERASILLEDAKLDPNDVLELDEERRNRLMELLSAYESFLEHFRDTTEDTVSAIKGLTTVSDKSRCGESDADDVDIDEYDGD